MDADLVAGDPAHIPCRLVGGYDSQRQERAHLRTAGRRAGRHRHPNVGRVLAAHGEASERPGRASDDALRRLPWSPRSTSATGTAWAVVASGQGRAPHPEGILMLAAIVTMSLVADDS